jgi:hypothetical protein
MKFIGVVLAFSLSVITQVASAVDIRYSRAVGATEVPTVVIGGLNDRPIRMMTCFKTNTNFAQCSSSIFTPVRGKVDTSLSAPLPGNYAGVDPTAPFWSALGMPANTLAFYRDAAPFLRQTQDAGWAIFVWSISEKPNRLLAHHIIDKSVYPIHVRSVDAGKVRGLLYFTFRSPAQPLAAVFSVGGCPESADTSSLNAYIASRGYAVFQAHYTSRTNPHSPAKCAGDISLLEDQLKWFQSTLPSRKVALLGISRGVSGVLWLSHLSKLNVAGIIGYHGDSIQMPAPLAKHEWSYRGTALPSLPSSPTTYLRRITAGATLLLNDDSRPAGQRKNFEDELSRFSAEEISSHSVPVNCKRPSLFFLARNDDLVPVDHALKVFQRKCNVENVRVQLSDATHNSYDVGNAANRRCAIAPADKRERLQCEIDIKTGAANAAQIVEFLSQYAASR